MSSSRSALGVLVRYVGPQWKRATLLAALLLSSIGLQLLTPQILRAFLDSAQSQGALSTLVRFAAVYLAAATAVQFLTAGATYVGADVGWTATNRLRADLMRHLMSLDMSYHKERTPGEMIERIDGDVTALSNFFSQFSVRVFGALLLLFGALTVFWFEDARVGLVVTLFAAFTLFVLLRVRRVGVEPTRQEREASAKLYGYIEERLTGLDDLRALGAGGHALRGFLAVQRDFFWKSRRAWIARSTVWQLSFILFALGYVGVLAMALGLYAAGAITIGTAYLYYQYMTLIEDPIDQLTQQLQELQKAGASLIRIGELLQLRPALQEGTLELPSGPLELQFDRVSFAYGEAPVLSDVSFTLGVGRRVGLLGRTGSGKTTLTRLVSRLYDPTAGAVRLAGLDTWELRTESLRSRVAVVTQDVQLFQASVRDNLTLFDDRVDDALVEAALREVGLGDWLAGQPDGVHTRLQAGSLSAGEAQLLAFARVLLSDPGLIILDEPSSRLDPATEALLTQAMERLLAGRTAIVIAHRLDTIARADDILVMGDGRVLEFAPREELAHDPHSRYSALLRAGRLDLEEDEAPQADQATGVLS
ncbi:ABC transporter ATP-binding protein [Deinococcus peraridilitoris]|uniref:ABC-type multidrug transport system, ATPase and permease component n=1 Tax=Deinococcus peraridilitoris (strain DSM 19664 / LMG 22246 / CIP 109416 / KR-200) TaxID=937777 RepID=L0A2Y1_DEIPD|nr:ABC transporter ATP-binding protein [Deinococcus peraridilitoris]AFZ67804.1 ABC-type multidrug transport system, ATPase and permease component [Deinococcus peraridilitoris DSM 19664]